MVSRDPKQQYDRETGAGLQPDPLIYEGRSSKSWIWVIFAVVVAAVIVTLIATNMGHRQAAQNQPRQGPPVTTGSGATQPTPALPSGRNTSQAPLNAQGKTQQ